MTVLKGQHAGTRTSDGAKRLAVGIVFALAGVAAGFAIGQFLEFSGDSDPVEVAGPLVERSASMQANINALIEGGRAQANALAAASAIYSGPLVERSLAMDRFYGARSGAYSGPLVERSLAMDRHVDAVVEGARAQAVALGLSE